MKKNTPLLIFTGLAVAAAGTLGAVLTGNIPGAIAPQPVAEAPATPPAATAPAETPAQPPVAAAPAAPTAPEPAAPAQPETQAAAPADASPPAADSAQLASAPAQEQPAPAPSQPEAPLTPVDPDIPSFDTVNVLPTGEAVVAGHAKPGSDVALKFAGVEVGRATAGSDGSFAIVPEKPLPVGAGELTLETTVAGKVLTAKDQIAVVVNRDQKPAVVARVEPEAPTQLVQTPGTVAGAPAKEVQLSAVDYDADGNIVFQGRVPPGGKVRFYIDNQLAGDVDADANGNWLFKGSAPIAPGTHTLRADEIDGTGKVISRAELPFLREEAEKVIAAAGAADSNEQPAAPAVAPEQPDQVQAKSPEAETQVASAGAEPAAVPMVAALPGGPPRIVIQPGNNLWRISRQVYGKGRLFTVIWEANRDQIKNPNRIYPGQILSAPKS